MFCPKSVYINIIPCIAILFLCTVPQTALPMQNKAPVIGNYFNADTVRPDRFLEDLLGQYPQYFDSILKNRTALNVQVIYTAINRDSAGLPGLQNHYFNLNTTRYFYPASTVKLPVVMLALQKLNELKAKGIDKNSTMITEEN